MMKFNLRELFEERALTSAVMSIASGYFKYDEKAPVIEFSKNSIAAAEELRSLTDPLYIRKIDITDVEKWGLDEDMLSGLRSKQTGIDLYSYDKETRELRYFDKKAVEEGDFIRGADGRVYITNDFLDRSTQPAAFYAPDIDPENPELSKAYYKKFKKIINAADDKGIQRNNDHFTLFRAEVTDLPEELSNQVNINTFTECYTNKCIYYVIDQEKDNTFSLSYYVPTWRDKESFIPAPLNDLFNIRRVKEVLAEGLTYPQAVDALQEHWQGVEQHDVQIIRHDGASRDQYGNILYKSNELEVRDNVSDIIGKSEVLYEEGHNLCDGTLASAWYKAMRAARYPFEHSRVLYAAGAVAAVSAAAGLKAGWGLAIGAALEVGAHVYVEERERVRRFSVAKKAAPAEYGGANTADITNKGNLEKNKPKPDKTKINASKNVVLNFDQRNCITNPHIAPDDMNPASLKNYIVKVGGMGISSTAELRHGSDVEQRVYNNGMVRTKLKLENGDVVYFARYRDDVVKRPDKQDMPPIYKDQMGQNINIVYRSKSEQSLKIQKDVSHSEAISLLEKYLQDEVFKFSAEERYDFVESFKIQMERPNYNWLDYGEELDRSNVPYMSGRTYRAPNSQASMPHKMRPEIE